MHPEAEEEAEIREMKDGLDPQRDFEQRGPELDIPPPPQSEGIHVEATFSDHHLPSYHLRHLTLLIMHLGWMSQLRSVPLGLQATFEHLQQSIDRIESRQVSQHEEMMAYLRFVFPPPPPQP
ncbi:hypothetical protein AAG906_038396 [Vitis piasezkii]